ncbi:MAG: hypothetical protein WAK03_11305 [Methylocystis sp.]
MAHPSSQKEIAPPNPEFKSLGHPCAFHRMTTLCCQSLAWSVSTLLFEMSAEFNPPDRQPERPDTFPQAPVARIFETGGGMI